VGYGRSVPRVIWPGAAAIAINIVVNYEEGSEYSFDSGDRENDILGESSYRFPPDVPDLAQESMYEYGSRAGIWRLFRLFDDLAVPCTIFGCAVAFEKNPAVARAAGEAGYDLLGHGWRWEEHWRLTRSEEREHISRAIRSFESTWGERPRGWYCRYGPSVNTRELVVEEGGFLYDSDAYNDDLPYFTEVADRQHLVVPYSLTYNDVKGTGSPAEFLDYLVRGFEVLHAEGVAGYPKMMSIGLHPRLAGQAARTSALREFLQHAAAYKDVWFAKREEIARWWIDESRRFV
jgi:peptidoglycan/xylan/chitin deacetylase (PgdA/CDA1 family)